MTLRGQAAGSNGEVNHRCWDLAGPSLPGLSPTREVPDDHHDPVRCPDPGCAGVHQHRAAGSRGILAGYSGLTRQAYELDLRQYASWCHQHHLRLF